MIFPKCERPAFLDAGPTKTMCKLIDVTERPCCLRRCSTCRRAISPFTSRFTGPSPIIDSRSCSACSALRSAISSVTLSSLSPNAPTPTAARGAASWEATYVTLAPARRTAAVARDLNDSGFPEIQLYRVTKGDVFGLMIQALTTEAPTATKKKINIGCREKNPWDVFKAAIPSTPATGPPHNGSDCRACACRTHSEIDLPDRLQSSGNAFGASADHDLSPASWICGGKGTATRCGVAVTLNCGDKYEPERMRMSPGVEPGCTNKTIWARGAASPSLRDQFRGLSRVERLRGGG